MKYVQPNGAHNMEKESQKRSIIPEKGAWDAWIKGYKEELKKVKDDVDAAKDYSDMESEHNTVPPQSPCRDDHSSEEDKGDFSILICK